MKNWVNIKRPNMKKARIEIIPMIDTIFFLLVFFMITSMQMVQMKGMDISLPQDSTSTQKPPPILVVTVDPDSKYYINRELVDQSALTTELQTRCNANNKSIIIVNVAKTLPTQTLIDVMDAVNEVIIKDDQGQDANPAVTIATSYTDPNATSKPGGV